ncbi:MAG: hypothetical protein Ct9H300mP25_12780 [Acidobacteriota bacterium]|nr:MAG: hypothetical protein Ct9H300mP25_12780 [Acidobacteriota bacterium]
MIVWAFQVWFSPGGLAAIDLDRENGCGEPGIWQTPVTCPFDAPLRQGKHIGGRTGVTMNTRKEDDLTFAGVHSHLSAPK